MSNGLRVFNSAGALAVDISSRLTRLITTLTYSVSAGGSVNISVTDTVNDGTWAVDCVPALGQFPPGVTINSGYITINNTDYSAHSGTLYVFRY